MTTTLAPARPATAARATFAALAARETRRFIVNPVFLFAVAITAWTIWAGRDPAVTDIDTVNSYPAIFLGGFGMMATFWLTRSMRASEPVVGVTSTTKLAGSSRVNAAAAPSNAKQIGSSTVAAGGIPAPKPPTTTATPVTPATAGHAPARSTWVTIMR